MSKILTADEVKRHNTRKSVWMVIRNEVYDVTAFIDEHPGGEDPILEAAGQDATIAFEDVGHSEDAKAMLKKYKIGTLAPGEGCCKMRAQIWRSSSPYHRDCTECNASRFPMLLKEVEQKKHLLTKCLLVCTCLNCNSTSDMPGTSDSKSWRSFDGGTPSSVSRKSSLKCFKEPGPPRHERRIQRIVVPKERRRPRDLPCAEPRRGKPCRPGPQPAPSPPAESGTSRWKYAVLALGVAILLGFAYKKYTSG